MKDEEKKDSITIPKKVIAGIAPVAAIVAILLSKDKVGEMFLFLIGVGAGIMIGVSWMKGKSRTS
ncbi:hypothetical protein [Lentiprolixibacter aurantiacus]|uniref:Uncharacterized protein n=1 Tax=Lentiprolixibacter aurantiacus TaxID=2993939 RepID=A0AAE3MKC2_9FLAO|nr:hypothetical protein [Lentiprolixibacter aurantiacus]MCX2718808.1 hypothetical protein [Lentiprolixibacter aurantiacus]